MRADRLLSLLMLLQTRGRMTAERLSAELEVSVRTIYRDVYALRVAGFPVYSERGLGGGCFLHKDYRMRLTDLTEDELAALFTMAVPTSLIDLGVGQEAKGALLKLAAALPAARREIEQHARRRIHLDPESWNPSREPAPSLSALRQGVWADRWMKATFRRVRGIMITQEIAPYGLVAKATRWYVIWLGRDRQLRVDHASSVIEAELLDEGFDRLETFDLASYWSQWAARYEANRSAFLTQVLAKEGVIPMLEREVGKKGFKQLAEHESGSRKRVELSFESFEQARSLLLGFGGAIEVVSPEALRRSMADFGERIRSMYRDS
ncbi:helix-turn-helix transcriptional regulator [Candidatus Bipolaricaulota bacterium]